MFEVVNVIGGILKRIIMYLSCLIPRSQNLYIFGAWFGEKYADNSRAMFEYITKNTDKKCVWITKNPEVFQKIKNMGYSVEITGSLKGIWVQLHAKVAFSVTGDADFNRLLLGNCYHIGLWHGVGGGKTIGLDDKEYFKYAVSRKGKIYRKLEAFPLRRNYMVCTSEEMKKVFKSAFLVSEDHFIFAGQPRNDMFYDSAYKMNTVNPTMFNGKKVILYMPTHRKAGRVQMNMSKLFDLKKIDLFCQKNNAVLVVKKHFYHSMERENLEKYHNILDITQMSMDSNELLKCADYLISDYSSVTADFLLLDKPILYYCFDLDEYLKEDRDMYWQFEDITPGPKVKNFNELLSALIRIIELNEDSYEAERNRVRRMFYAPESQCKSAKKIFDQVVNIIR